MCSRRRKPTLRARGWRRSWPFLGIEFRVKGKAFQRGVVAFPADDAVRLRDSSGFLLDADLYSLVFLKGKRSVQAERSVLIGGFNGNDHDPSSLDSLTIRPNPS